MPVTAASTHASSVPLTDGAAGVAGVTEEVRHLPEIEQETNWPRVREGTFESMSFEWQGAKRLSIAKLPSIYLGLSKARLAALVTLTTMCGYSMVPFAHDLSTMFWMTTGTALCIASANTINQWIEVPYDACMSRTWNRPLVRRDISPLHALTFGVTSGVVGVSALALMVNPTTAVLGGMNVLLYTAVYTPLKRRHIVNTWVGSVVGAIPPMMGWAAATNTILDPRAFLLGSILYCWQFPHFNALSHYIRHEYKRAGYTMMADTHPALNKRVALRYSLVMLPLSACFPYLGMTSWWFALDSSLATGIMSFYAYRYYSTGKDNAARKLFFFSLLHLPIFFALMMIHKKPEEDMVLE
jgi:protoheme IX farnesyltransferase